MHKEFFVNQAKDEKHLYTSLFQDIDGLVLVQVRWPKKLNTTIRVPAL